MLEIVPEICNDQVKFSGIRYSSRTNSISFQKLKLLTSPVEMQQIPSLYT